MLNTLQNVVQNSISGNIYISVTAGVFILVSLTAIAIRKFSDDEVIKAIIKQKQDRTVLIKFLDENIESTCQKVNLLQKNKEIVGVYNLEILAEILTFLKNLVNVMDHLVILENKVIENKVKAFFGDAINIFEEIYEIEYLTNIEKTNYFKKINEINRKHRELTTVEDDDQDKQRFIYELNNELSSVKETLNVIITKKDHVEVLAIDAFVKIRSEGEEIRELLKNYKQNEVDTKRFYITHFAYV